MLCSGRFSYTRYAGESNRSVNCRNVKMFCALRASWPVSCGSGASRTVTMKAMSMNIKHGLIALAALAVGIIRPFLTSHPLSAEGSYEAFAHLFVGGLIGAWLVTRERLYLRLVVGLSIVELASALFKR